MSPASAAASSRKALIWSATPWWKHQALSGLPAHPTVCLQSRSAGCAHPPSVSLSSLSKPCAVQTWGLRSFNLQGGVFQEWGTSVLRVYKWPEPMAVSVRNIRCHWQLYSMLQPCSVFRLQKRTALCRSSLWISGSLCEEALPCHDPGEAQRETQDWEQGSYPFDHGRVGWVA